MKASFPHRLVGLAVAVAVALAPAPLLAEQIAPPAPLGKPARTVYRQVMPDGSIVYSDKILKGAKLDETLHVEPMVEGTTWATESGRRPTIPPRNEPTPVARVPDTPALTLEQASAEVIRAEMLLEDARKKQEAGVEPLPGERTANAGGGSRLNDAYHARQKRLAEEVAIAEAALKKAAARRDALRGSR